jgi:hypothetical protein
MEHEVAKLIGAPPDISAIAKPPVLTQARLAAVHQREEQLSIVLLR